ncbi:MAG: hypothetical protein ACOX2R_06935 [Anaerolineae bacterium]|jgi:capsular polysaccharide biosynthesis protein
MDLAKYWDILRRRAWIPVALVCVTLLSYLWAPPPRTTGYAASMRFAVGVLPEESGGAYYTYDRYYTWLTAEYLVDDLSEIVKSRVFAADVSLLAGLDLPAGAIQGATSAGKLHRILAVSIGWHDAAQLAAIAEATATLLTEKADAYLAQLGTEQAVIHLIDPPAVIPLQPSLRQRLDPVLRVGLALVLGIVVAFGLHAVDPTIRAKDELEALGVRVLALVPPTRPWWHRILWRRRDV